MAVSLPDQYVLLLQKVIDENRLLREQVKSTVDTTNSSIEVIKKKVDSFDNVLAAPSRRVRHTGPAKPIRVPKLCRVSCKTQHIFGYFNRTCLSAFYRFNSI
jgi:hypothetical protein